MVLESELFMKTRLPLSIFSFAATALALVSPVSATLIWAENFDDDTIGSSPISNYPGGGAGNDWTISNAAPTTTAVSAIGKSGNGLGHTDNDSGATNGLVSTTQFAPFALSSTNNLLRFTFDFRVDSFSNGNASYNPRVLFRSSTVLDEGIVVGFSRSAIADGDSSQDNYLFAAKNGNGTSNVSASAAAAVRIGFTGSSWAPGFDFGSYDAATAANNNTGGEFVNFQLTYDYNTGLMSGIATTAGGGTATFALSLVAGMNFTGGAIGFASSASSSVGTAPDPVVVTPATSTAYVDNLSVEIIPEPSSSAMLLGGLSLLFIRRKR